MKKKEVPVGEKMGKLYDKWSKTPDAGYLAANPMAKKPKPKKKPVDKN